MFVPNSFQTPNDYVDSVMPHLTGEEYKVLSYATRRILGFQKRQDRISISQFTDGTKSKDGEVLDSGTGLSNETVKKCLASLVSFNLMIRVGENDPRTNEGTLWELQWDDTKVNWQALKEREEKKRKVYKKVMKKARSMRHTPPNDIELTPPNDIERGGANGIETQKTVETQGNTVGADAPENRLPLDWQIAMGKKVLVQLSEEEQLKAKIIDSANLIDFQCPGAGDLAEAFMDARKIVIPQSKAKGNRKAAREMLEMGVRAEHVTEATLTLMDKHMTVTDLFSVSKTAIDLANRPIVPEVIRPEYQNVEPDPDRGQYVVNPFTNPLRRQAAASSD